MSQSDIHEVEVTIEDARKVVKRGEALERLMRNKDFKEIVLDHYFRDEAVRLVHLKSDPNMQEDRMQEAVDTQIRAVGSLRFFFDRLQAEAEQMAYAIEENQNTLEELREEGE